MPIYQNTSVTDAKIEIGNYTISVGLENATAASTWTNMGAGMVKSFKYDPVMYTSQAGNAVDPIQGVSRETVEVGIELIEYLITHNIFPVVKNFYLENSVLKLFISKYKDDILLYEEKCKIKCEY